MIGGQWSKIFMVIFRSTLNGCLLFFSLASLTESRSFWYRVKDLFTLHNLADKVVVNIYVFIEQRKISFQKFY